MSNNDDEPDTIIITHSSSTNTATKCATNDARQKVNFKIQILILLFSLPNSTSDRVNNKILFNFINLPIAKVYNQTYFFFVII